MSLLLPALNPTKKSHLTRPILCRYPTSYLPGGCLSYCPFKQETHNKIKRPSLCIFVPPLLPLFFFVSIFFNVPSLTHSLLMQHSFPLNHVVFASFKAKQLSALFTYAHTMSHLFSLNKFFPDSCAVTVQMDCCTAFIPPILACPPHLPPRSIFTSLPL